MSNIVTDIKALQEETLLNLQNSKASNTVRAYKSDFKDFGLFCVQNGLKNIPSYPKIVSLYLTHLSTKDLKIPIRVEFILIFGTTTSEFSTINAEQTINAAEDGSLGTDIFCGLSSG